MAVNTKELPKIATNISGTFMTQSTMTMDEFELEVPEQLLESLNVDAFISKLEIDSKVQVHAMLAVSSSSLVEFDFLYF